MAELEEHITRTKESQKKQTEQIQTRHDLLEQRFEEQAATLIPKVGNLETTVIKCEQRLDEAEQRLDELEAAEDIEVD